MGLSAGDDCFRREVDLQSQRGAFPTANRLEAMSPAHYEEFRHSVNGMTIELRRNDSIQINPIETPSNLVRVIFGTDISEGARGHTVNLKLIAADVSRPGMSYRLNPDEICLIQKFDEPSAHDIRHSAQWDSKLGFLQFSGLQFGSRYVLVFTTAGAGEFAEAGLPGIPGVSKAINRREPAEVATVSPFIPET